MIEKSKKISEFLVCEHKSNKRFKNLTGDLKPKSISEAYLAQHYFHESAGRGSLGGYKIALSSKIQQEHHNINQPLIGGLFKSEILFGPQILERNKYKGLGIEIELAFQLSNKIREFNKKIHLDDLKKIIAKVFPAIELVEDREANYSGLDPLSLICDNAWSGGLVLGEEILNWDKVNFSNLYSKVVWNEENETYAPVMDADPFNNLCWLLNDVKSRNKPLEEGMIVITGSVFQIRPGVKGDKVAHKVGQGNAVSIELK
mgnify:CR=1 FL=1|tara:strand:+ start:174 stop:950 length:777 start_codon:yes stop_codon:yes gene_type:complete